MGTTAVKKPYGAVFQTWRPRAHKPGEFPHGTAWRGILMDEDHEEVWWGRACGHPDDALESMKEAAKALGITDLRPWSGDAPR